MGKLLVLLVAIPVLAADLDPALLSAAKKGRTAEIRTLLARGANLESRDKQGRTPLMLAAANGREETVRFLLDRGSQADARDRLGWTAWGLAYISDEPARDKILPLLPAVPPGRIAVQATWAPENLYSSCFLTPPQLVDHVAGLQLDDVLLVGLRDAAALSKRRLVEFTAGEGDALLTARIRPGASCLAQQSADQLSLALDAKLNKGQALLFEKTLGGGLKGLHVRTVRSPAQYQPLYAEWTAAHARQIYELVLEAWLRSGT